jgi:hypothetical protein
MLGCNLGCTKSGIFPLCKLRILSYCSLEPRSNHLEQKVSALVESIIFKLHALSLVVVVIHITTWYRKGSFGSNRTWEASSWSRLFGIYGPRPIGDSARDCHILATVFSFVQKLCAALWKSCGMTVNVRLIGAYRPSAVIRLKGTKSSHGQFFCFVLLALVTNQCNHIITRVGSLSIFGLWLVSPSISGL